MNWLHALLLAQSCKLGNSILDWIRSIYFSLLGSSVLNFSLKFFSFDFAAIGAYVTGIALFLLGLLYSVRITKRFKSYEKSWTINVPDPKVKPLDDYCKEQEFGEGFSRQHTLLYTLWLPALLFIGIVSFRTDLRPKPVTNQEMEQLSRLEQELEELNVANAELKRIEVNMESLLKQIGGDTPNRQTGVGNQKQLKRKPPPSPNSSQ